MTLEQTVKDEKTVLTEKLWIMCPVLLYLLAKLLLHLQAS